MVQIMPFMEQSQLSVNLGRICDTMPGATPVPVADYKYIEAVVPQFYCPSRRDSKSYDLVSPFTEKYGPYGARTDFAMSGGAAFTADVTLAGIDLQQPGVWQVGIKTQMKEVTDGTSNTLYLGEKAMNPLRYKNGLDYGDRVPLAGYPEYSAAANSYVRFIARGTEHDSASSCMACHDFGSGHAPGWNAVMTDGSIRTVSYNADMAILKAVASIAGNDIGSLDN